MSDPMTSGVAAWDSHVVAAHYYSRNFLRLPQKIWSPKINEGAG